MEGQSQFPTHSPMQLQMQGCVPIPMQIQDNRLILLNWFNKWDKVSPMKVSPWKILETNREPLLNHLRGLVNFGLEQWRVDVISYLPYNKSFCRAGLFRLCDVTKLDRRHCIIISGNQGSDMYGCRTCHWMITTIFENPTCPTELKRLMETSWTTFGILTDDPSMIQTPIVEQIYQKEGEESLENSSSEEGDEQKEQEVQSTKHKKKKCRYGTKCRYLAKGNCHFGH